MNVNELSNNSHAAKEREQAQKAPAENEKRAQAIVKSKNVKTKKNEVRKFKDVFVAEDVNNVKSYILDDLLIPTVKNLFVDMVQNSIEMLILGGRRGGSGRRSTVDHVSYRDYYSDRRRDRDYDRGSKSRSSFDYDDIIFESRGAAEAVLDEMDRIIRKYGFVRVLDLYDMCELTAPYTAQDYGWMSISRAEVTRVRNGYIIKMPKASPID